MDKKSKTMTKNQVTAARIVTRLRNFKAVLCDELGLESL